jgi:hypothetical protein
VLEQRQSIIVFIWFDIALLHSIIALYVSKKLLVSFDKTISQEFKQAYEEQELHETDTSAYLNDSISVRVSF